MTNENFIQRRLDSLNLIDDKIVKLLHNLGGVLETYVEPIHSNKDETMNTKDLFTEEVRNIYSLLSDITRSLRGEVKIMDENIGSNEKNEDSIMILPIAIVKKQPSLGNHKLKEILKH